MNIRKIWALLLSLAMLLTMGAMAEPAAESPSTM